MSEPEVVEKQGLDPLPEMPKQCCAMEIPKFLIDELRSRLVNVWTTDPNRGIQGIVTDWDHQFLRIKSVDGRDMFITWAAGPMIQKI